MLLAGLTGWTTIAYGAAKKLSEADACGLAKAEIMSRQGGTNKREVNVISCGKFSKLDIGAASIQVVYDTSYFNDYMKARYETKNLADKCHFIQSAQGWKLVDCK
jgi:hypothetical protein